MAATFKTSKKAHEFIGLCLGILADNKLVTEEVEFLRTWLRDNPKLAGSYPVKGLFIRICEMLEDEKIDESEEKELFQHLYEVTGTGKGKSTLKKLPEVSAEVVYCDPIPQINFDGQEFYLCGQFIIGTPDRLCAIIRDKGGVISDELSSETAYCIIGAMADFGGGMSDELGRSINALRSKKMKVISEESWVNLIF